MEKVPPQALPDPAQPTVTAVVDGFVWIIVPQLAHTAEIVGGRVSAPDTGIGGLLGASAEHAEHVLGLFAREGVVLVGIMAESTCIPFLTRRALHLDISAVVLASQPGLVVVVCEDDVSQMVDNVVGRGRFGDVCRCEVVFGKGEVEGPGRIPQRVPELERVQRPRALGRIGVWGAPAGGGFWFERWAGGWQTVPRDVSLHQQLVHQPRLVVCRYSRLLDLNDPPPQLAIAIVLWEGRAPIGLGHPCRRAIPGPCRGWRARSWL